MDSPRFTPEEPFRWNQFASVVAEAVRTEVGLALVDTPLNVATGQLVRQSVAAESDVVWDFTEGVDFQFGELVDTPLREERYAQVVASGEPLVEGEPPPPPSVFSQNLTSTPQSARNSASTGTSTSGGTACSWPSRTRCRPSGMMSASRLPTSCIHG